jgi:biopolymer transport protein ExbD
MILFKRRHRREAMELQLTAMIDIFTLIVIFLVMGSVLGVAEVAIPEGMKLPKSRTIEGIDTAPQLIIRKDLIVQLKGLSLDFPSSAEVPVADFLTKEGINPEVEKITAEIIKYAKPESLKGKQSILNVLADKDVKYKDVFDVIQFFRKAGFESLLFVATGDKTPIEPEGGG